jgi:hypothetical protein
LLEKNLDKVNWNKLSKNPNAIKLLEANLDKINWNTLSMNPNAIHILEKNLDKVDWYLLSSNPNAINLLEKNQDKIYWGSLTENPSIFEYDYSRMKERCSIFKEELVSVVFHPDNYHRFVELGCDEFSD